jgi:hypothetical protein
MPGASGDDAVLESAFKELMAAWQATQDRWRDSARQDFERAFLEDLHTRVKLAVRSIKQMEALMRQAIQACSR